MQLISYCESLHSLPESGGIFNQDSYFMYIYGIVNEARAVKAELDRQKKGS